MDVVLSESEDDSEASRVQDVDDGGISGDDWMWSLTHEVAETQAGIKTPLASTLVRLQRRQQARVLAVQRLIDTSMAHDETRSCVESPVRTLDVRSHADDVSTDHTALLSTQDDVVKKLVFTLSQVGPTTSESCQCGDWLGLSDRLASSIQSVTSSVAFAFQMVTEKVESIEVSHPHVQCVLCLRQQFSIRCDATPRRRPVESLHSYFTTSHCEVRFRRFNFFPVSAPVPGTSLDFLRFYFADSCWCSHPVGSARHAAGISGDTTNFKLPQT
jgi:hypothetical protein